MAMTWIDLPDPPWITNWEQHREEYYQREGGLYVSVDKWAYSPEKCDYEYCVGDCDRCPLAEEDDEEEGDEDANV